MQYRPRETLPRAGKAELSIFPPGLKYPTMPTIDTLLFIHLCLVTWFVFLYVLLPRIGFANSIDYYCQMSQCFRDKSCGSSDSEDDETCKKRCRSKCCSFSRNKAKQGDAIEEANERLCNTSAERECRKSCFESRDCGDSDDCKKVRLRIQFMFVNVVLCYDYSENMILSKYTEFYRNVASSAATKMIGYAIR